MEQRFRVCGLTVVLHCNDPDICELLRSVFGGLAAAGELASDPILRYELARDPASRVFSVTRAGSSPLTAESVDELLFLLDKDLTVELQRLRADLFFVHAGVVEHEDGAWAVSAPSGTGKSTTVWALVCDGLRYLSDELAPLEFGADHIQVHPYARALNLKSEPGAPFGLPTTALRFPEAFYVPTHAMRTPPPSNPQLLQGFFFLRRQQHRASPRAKRLTVAEAASHLYANALNPLAHPTLGLDTAIAIAARLTCFDLELGDSPANVEEIRRCMKEGNRARD